MHILQTSRTALQDQYLRSTHWVVLSIGQKDIDVNRTNYGMNKVNNTVANVTVPDILLHLLVTL